MLSLVNWSLPQLPAEGWISVLFGIQQFCQSTAQHTNDLEWNEIDYFMQTRQLYSDVLDNIREDLQDVYEKDERSLDTKLLVATLMLGFGFGFVVEGTFPLNRDEEPEDNHHFDDQQVARLFYIVLLSFSVTFPFLSMCCLLECRRRLGIFMKAFNDHFYNLVKKEFADAQRGIRGEAEAMSLLMRNTTKRLPTSVWGCCVKRHLRPDVVNKDAKLSHKKVIFSSQHKVKVHYRDFWKKSIDCILHGARGCMFLGMCSNFLCAIFLLGVYFESKYEDQTVWKVYCCCMSVGFVVALIILGVPYCTGPTEANLKRSLKSLNEPLTNSDL